jgi:cholesterol transport system auxiliary component
MTSAATGARRPSRRRILAGVVAGASVLVVSSCGLGGGPSPRQFTLTPMTDFPHGLPPVKWSLVVDEPTAARQIDTSRIARMSGPFRIEYYADVEWTDTAPAMVQLLLMQSFQNTGRLPVVAPTRQTLVTDLLLLSNLRKFQVEKDAAGTLQATVALEVTLLRMPRRTPAATAPFERATQVNSNSADTVIAAFDSSLGDVMRRVVNWTLQQASAAARAAKDEGPKRVHNMAEGGVAA